MLGRKGVLFTGIVLSGLLAGAAIGGAAFAQRQAVPRRQPDRLALGEDDVKKLLLLMETNQDGKISKEEWMKFMEAEFDRLDKDKSGALDAKELTQSRLRPSAFAKAGK